MNAGQVAPQVFEVGRYAVYVGGAYAASALVIAALALDTLLRAWRWRRRAERAGGRRRPTGRLP